MNTLFKKKTTTKSVRHIVLDDRALKKAVKESIKDQKKITAKADKLRKLRAQLAR
jgi:hypothetical protein